MNYAIETKDLVKTFGWVKAANGISIQIPEKSIFGLVGPNGSGKTTLFSLVAGFIRPDSGSFSVLGESVPSSLGGRFSILPQDARFQPNIPIVDQYLFYLQLMGFTRRKAYEEIERVLTIVGSPDVLDRPHMRMSHGQYKRLTVAQAFLGNPELILLDEPTTGLDLASAESIRANIKALQGSATVVISSHNMEELQRLCDYAAVLSKGELQTSGPVKELFRAQKTLTVKFDKELSTLDKSSLLKLERIGDIVSLEEPFTYRVSWAPKPEGDEFRNKFMREVMDKGYQVVSILEENPFARLYQEAVKN